MIQTGYFAYRNSEKAGNVTDTGRNLHSGMGTGEEKDADSFSEIFMRRAEEMMAEDAFTGDTAGSEQELGALESFRKMKESFVEEHKLTPDNIKAEEDWREMSEESWNKLMEHIDKFIEDYKERMENMKKLQEEAARKMAAEAPAEMRSIAVSQAVLRAAANGIAGTVSAADPEELEKSSWTYELESEDQEVLLEAKKANRQMVELSATVQESVLVKDVLAETIEVEDEIGREEKNIENAQFN